MGKTTPSKKEIALVEKSLATNNKEVTEEIVNKYLWGQEQGISDAQRTVFLEVCKVNNLNPFKKEVYAVPFYDSKKKKYDLQPVTSYTVYLARANESGLLDGWNVELEKDDNGNVTSGKITIHRKDRSYPFVWVLDFEEVVMRNYNTKKPTWLWNTKPAFMLKKTLISQGMRMCLPECLASLPYDESEIPTGENSKPAAMQKAEIVTLDQKTEVTLSGLPTIVSRKSDEEPKKEEIVESSDVEIQEVEKEEIQTVVVEDLPGKKVEKKKQEAVSEIAEKDKITEKQRANIFRLWKLLAYTPEENDNVRKMAMEKLFGVTSLTMLDKKQAAQFIDMIKEKFVGRVILDGAYDNRLQELQEEVMEQVFWDDEADANRITRIFEYTIKNA